jgi:hypothetical protein
MDAGSSMTAAFEILYHTGLLMCCQEIQEATASEPLALDEEHAMQQSWREDPDKLTFIICRPGEKLGQVTAVEAGTYDSPDAMIGDVNMFISLGEDSTRHQPLVIGELELMIAKRAQQRNGYGRAALLSFLMYVLHHEAAILRQYWNDRDGQPPPSRFAYFAAKIGKENGRSLALFDSLGFKRTSEEPNYWGEYESRHAALSKETLQNLVAENGIGQYTELDYRR